MNNPIKFFAKHGVVIGLLHLYTMVEREASIQYSSFIFKLKLMARGCRYGKNIRVDGGVLVSSKKANSITIGDHFKLNSAIRSNFVGITNKAVFQIVSGGKIKIGSNCGFTSTILSSRVSISIGNQVKIGANVRIFDHDYHSLNYLERRSVSEDNLGCASSPVIIGDDVFIGTNSIILKGVTVGARSVIGAGAVVTISEIPPDSLVAGNPARIIRQLTTFESSDPEEIK